MRSIRMLGRVAVGACAAALFASAAAAQATQGTDTVPVAVLKNRRDVRIFLNRNVRLADRLSAGAAAQEATGIDQETGAIALFRDTRADARLRALALDLVPGAVASDLRLQRDVANVLADRTALRVLRDQALAVIESLSFSNSPSTLAGGEARARLLSLLDDPDPAFRLRGITLLMQEEDETARARLVEGLRTPTTAAVPAADAVRLLGRNLMPDVLPLLRQLMTSPPDQATRIEAIRALGRDTESREAIAALLRDTQQAEAVRLQALASLSANLPAPEFTAYALSIVTEETAGDPLRAYAIQSVKYRRGTVTEQPEDEFDAAVRAIAASASTSAVLRQVATGYVRARGR